MIATAVVMGAQFVWLGTPQTVVRYTGRRMPTRLLATHAGVLSRRDRALATLVRVASV